MTSAYWQSTGHITPPATEAFEQIGRRIEEFDATGSSIVLYQIDAGG